jgi:hypothetical protein
MLLDAVTYIQPQILLASSRARQSEGLYIGVDIVFGGEVYWNLKDAPRKHMLVIGPTGSGKTIALSALASRIAKRYGTLLTVIDVKNEYRHNIELFMGEDPVVWDIVQDPIPLCSCEDPEHEKLYSVRLFVNTLSKVFNLPSYARDYMTEQLKKACISCASDSLDTIVQSSWIEESEQIQTVLEAFKASSNMSATSMLNIRTLIIDASRLLTLDTKSTATVALYTLKLALRAPHKHHISSLSRIVVLDELWYITQEALDEFIEMLVRLARGYGIVVAMATQSAEDLEPYADSIAGNCGLLIALSSTSRSHWLKAARLLNMSKKGVEIMQRYSEPGIAAVKMAQYEKPFYVYIDPLD